MEQPPDLSVVIPSWNTCELLQRCLRSLQAGFGSLRAEIIVVDNGSRDGTSAMVREHFPTVVLLENAGNQGFARASNRGLREARGRHVLLLNSDTEVLGEVLPHSVAYLDRETTVGVLGCRVLNPDGSLQPTCFRFPSPWNLLLLASGLDRLPGLRYLGRYTMKDWQRDDEREVDVVTGCFLLVRAEALATVGELDEGFFFYGEDTDWCCRFRRAGWRVRFAPIGEITHVGDASGRQLRSRRDVLLTAALVRLNWKYSGRAAACLTWLLLLLFTLSRWQYWTWRGILSRGPLAAQRRAHFRGVLAGYASVWPTARRGLA